MLRPGYGLPQLHLRQSANTVVEILGEPAERKDTGSFRQYWLFPQCGLDLIVSRRTGLVLSIFMHGEGDFAGDLPFGEPVSRVLEQFGKPDLEGGGFEIDKRHYFGRWYAYHSGLGFNFDRAGLMCTVIISSARQPKKSERGVTGLIGIRSQHYDRNERSGRRVCLYCGMRRLLFLFTFFFALPVLAQVSVSFPASRSTTALNGRVLFLLSNDPSAEPRMQIDDTPRSQQVFGVTVDGLKPVQPVAINDSAQGYPVRKLSDMPPGEYTVQAVLNVYETFHRGDGKTVKLAPDRGEGQHWNLAPGNLYSTPRVVRIGPGAPPISVSLDQVIGPIAPEPDTKYVRHLRIRSDLLTRFWGRPMFLAAIVLLPEGFDEHPNAHYPEAIFHGHFPEGVPDFRTTPPDPNLKPDYSDRFHLAGYNRIQQQQAYDEYRRWISPGFPRILVIQIQHANPFYDDSYAVNSANVGPYGDAIEHELLPAVERKFRGIGQGWARFLYGGSTGGWESLAVQMFYPDDYNGAFVACPDPVDFHAYMTRDLYEDDNMFYAQGANKRVEQPAMRDYLGHTLISVRDNVAYEAALGDHGRSGEQFDIWQAVYGPVGADGYPQPIFDKQTGTIDHQTAAYWREHFDLNAILMRDWNTTLGPKLQGKLHLYVGSDDTYFLNDAVYLMEDFLKTTGTPGHGVAYGGEVKYGPRAEHCWNGDPALPNALSRLHYNTMYLPQIMERIARTAPAGADMSWKY